MTSVTTDRINGTTTSVSIKAPVVVATIANITLSAEQTIDGTAVTDGQRVLVKDQSTASENGIYEVSTGDWTRAIDFDGPRDVVSGTQVYAAAGSTQSAGLYVLTTADPITLGTTSLSFSATSFGVSGTAASFTVTGSTVPANGIYLPTTNTVGIAANSAVQVYVTPTGDGTNYVVLRGADSAANPAIFVGGETNVGLSLISKGTGALDFFTNTTAQQFRVTNTTSAVNYLAVTGSSSTTPTLSAAGSSSNVDIVITPKGSGVTSTTSLAITGTTIPSDCGLYRSSVANLGLVANGARQFRVTGNASSVDYIVVQGAVAGGIPLLYTEGSDTDITLGLASKGSDPIVLYTNATTPQVHVTHTASAVNRIELTGGAAGAPATVIASAAGTSTNIDFVLTPKGSGVLKFGTTGCFTANSTKATTLTSVGPAAANTTVQEWLTIKNSTGTTRYIPAW